MLLTLALTLAMVGAAQYALVARTLTDRASQQLLSAFSADAMVLRDLHDAPAGGLDAASELLNHMAARPGIHRVALVSADGTVLAVGSGYAAVAAQANNAGEISDMSGTDHMKQTGDMSDMAEPGDLADAGATADARPMDSMNFGRTVGRAVEPEAARAVREVSSAGVAAAERLDGDIVVRVPVRLGVGVDVLEVVRSGADVRRQVDDLRLVLVLTLAVGLLVAVPLLYVLGGAG